MIEAPTFLEYPQWVDEKFDDAGDVVYSIKDGAPEDVVKSFDKYIRQEESFKPIGEDGNPIDLSGYEIDF